MALTESKHCALGDPAPAFSLPGVDARGLVKNYSLEDFKDRQVLIVMFMCNHCPYVIAVQDRINGLATKWPASHSGGGVGLIGINSNDPVAYPDDSFEKMKERSREQGFQFPYAQDLDQSVARAYDAACTPDPYVFERVGSEFILRYHGRIDDHWKDARQVKHRDLEDAVQSILERKPVKAEQVPSMGCNIKWSRG